MSEMVNQFKNRLDKFWSNQDLIYNYKVELTGIGNRSSIKIEKKRGKVSMPGLSFHGQGQAGTKLLGPSWV